MKKLTHRNCSQKVVLTPAQRLNMRNMGLNVESNSTEKDCLKVLRRMKFANYGMVAKG